jgi:hypothetical protein
MGFTVSLRSFDDLDAGLVRELRAFAAAYGSHDDDFDSNDAFWRSTAPSSQALADAYDSATAYALEWVLDEVLQLRKWKTAHGERSPQWVMVPPFSFSEVYEGTPPFWAKLTTESQALLLCEPDLLLVTWKGAHDAKYRDSCQRAFAELSRCKPGDDDGRAVRGVEYALYQLARQGWAQRMPVVIHW